MRPSVFFLIFILLCPFYLPAFFIFLFISKKSVTKILYRYKKLFYPLRIVLLTPGVIHSFFVRKTRWFRHTGSGDEVILILGGNAMSPNQAYDGIYAQLVKDQKEELDCACLPLQLHFDEKAYTEYLLAECREQILHGRTTLSIYGHSLGGALALVLAKELAKQYPELKIHLFLSRTFNRLWDVSRYLYGRFIGQFFEKVFSDLWALESQKHLDELDLRNIAVRLEQTVPDEILGPALLVPGKQRIDYRLYHMDSRVHLYPEMVHAVSQAHLDSLKKRGWLKESFEEQK